MLIGKARHIAVFLGFLLSALVFGQEKAIPVSTLGVERLEDMHYARHCHNAIWVNGEIVVVGGHTTGFVPLSSAEYYRDGEWHLAEQSLYPHDGAFALTLQDGRVLLGGGLSESFGVGHSLGMEWYNPETHHFSPAGILSKKRAFSSAIGLQDGNIMVCGNWMGDDVIEVLNHDAKVLFTKPVSVPRLSPFLFKTADGDVKVLGRNADGTGWSPTMDALKGEPETFDFPDQWYPLFSARAYSESNNLIAPYTYLFAARRQESGETAIMKFENDRFSLLETDFPFPDILAQDDSLFWHFEGFITDRNARCAYMPASVSDGRFAFLKVDYNPALDGGKAAVSMIVSSDPLPVRFSEVNAILLPGNRIAVTGGIFHDNFEPLASAFIFHLDDANPSAARSFPWLWVVLILLGTGSGVFIGELHQKRGRRAAEKPSAMSPEEIEDMLMKQIVSKMEAEKLYLRKGLTITDLAAELNSNKTYISIILNQRRGKSFSAFVNGYRIEYAKSLMLEHPEMRVADVADAAGFADETSFFRNFKQATGLTPSAWRTKMINN